MKRQTSTAARTVFALLLTIPLLTMPSLLSAQSNGHADSGLVESLDEVKLGVQVKLALLEQMGTTALAIDVDVESDKVSLTGDVDEQANKKLAQQTALSVDGVSDVDNRIEVTAPADSNSPISDQLAKAERALRDAMLEGKVKSKLLAEIGQDAMDIEVEATDGMVILRGELPSETEVQTALEMTKRLDGVEQVRNLLDISA